MNDVAKASLAGHSAARAGLPATRNPYRPGEGVRLDEGECAWLDLVWFNAWHVTAIEIEEKTKLLEHDVRKEDL